MGATCTWQGVAYVPVSTTEELAIMAITHVPDIAYAPQG
jgi:hypothetical protein